MLLLRIRAKRGALFCKLEDMPNTLFCQHCARSLKRLTQREQVKRGHILLDSNRGGPLDDDAIPFCERCTDLSHSAATQRSAHSSKIKIAFVTTLIAGRAPNERIRLSRRCIAKVTATLHHLTRSVEQSRAQTRRQCALRHRDNMALALRCRMRSAWA